MIGRAALLGKASRFSSLPGTRSISVEAMKGREVIDSRGNPTVEVDVHTSMGMFRASVPSGASTGIHEAVELRDGGSRYLGKGVLNACKNVNDIIAQTDIDNAMIALDGTPNKSVLGANAILGGMPLYQHYADLAGNSELEFMILPTGAASFTEAMVMGCEVYGNLKNVIKKKYGQDACNVGDEGGFAPSIQSNYEGLSGYEKEVKIGMDVAASEFLLPNGNYDLDFKTENNDGSQVLSGEKLGALYRDLSEKYPIVSIEDPFDQDDWDNYTAFTAAIGDKVQVVGDDLLVTNVTRIQEASSRKACNALLLKVNQIGSVTESINAVKLSKQNGWGVMTSHRSGETEDNYIADLARLAKYNQLLRIEEELGSSAKYAGNSFRSPAWMA
eukprot:GSChrysophyteH1.ASY1.ANO1.2294.1 assembled CDS